MSTIREQLQHRYTWMAKSLAVVSQIETAAEGLEIMDGDFYLDFGEVEYINGESVPGAFIRLRPREVPGVRFSLRRSETSPYLQEPSLEVVNTAPTLADAARTLLSKVGRWEKEFDGQNNLLRLVGTYKGVRIILSDTPPETCTIRKVEVEEVVPAREAYTTKRTKYVLEGDCDPLLATVASA